MADEPDRLGSSGVFKAIVDGARKFTRAVTGAEEELSPAALEIGDRIARAFIAGKLGDVLAAGTPQFQRRQTREQFDARWNEAVKDHLPLTGFHVADAGQIDLGFIPGLEEVPQSKFVAFLEIAFSSPDVGFDGDRAFRIGAVLLDEGGTIKIGALHSQ